MYDPDADLPHAGHGSAEEEARSHPLMALIQQSQTMASFLNYDADGNPCPTDQVADLPDS